MNTTICNKYVYIYILILEKGVNDLIKIHMSVLYLSYYLTAESFCNTCFFTF